MATQPEPVDEIEQLIQSTNSATGPRPMFAPSPVDSRESFIAATTTNDQISAPDPVQGVATVTVTDPAAPATPATPAINSPNGPGVAAPVVEARIVPISNPVNDWRARLQLSPQTAVLYNAPDPGILAPLRATSGVLFPYTPQIDVIHRAEYSEQQLPHSNWKSYHYNGSNVGPIQMQATFTAQDNNEAAYMLAVIHFFRSATKMFYGQDVERGVPPPTMFLSAFGAHQYNRVPVVIQDFNYILPNDVHYVRTAQGTVAPAAIEYADTGSRYTNPLSSALIRLRQLGVSRGGHKATSSNNGGITLGNDSSYVPTKIEITLTLLPIPNRAQISTEFSLKDYANGTLLKRGFI